MLHRLRAGRYWAFLDRGVRRGVSRNESAQIEWLLCGTQPGPAMTARRRQCRKTVTGDIQLRGFRRCGECLTTNRVMSGARPITNSSRTDCRASTNGRSTCGVELAMMAIESRPPGLVAKYAVSASVPVNLTRHCANAAQNP